jgi:phenylacetate-coenzyme A ligase PaaK-like adenylate-forming protein
MADDRFKRMREVYGEAVALAPALRARFAQAGLSPQDLTSREALNRLPVLKKERLMELQQAEPPFAGYLACRPEEIGHIYASPGPIFEPSLAADKSGHGMDMMFAAAGIGPGDLVLNTWSYHLVPAGLLFDQGARAVGATVIPGGTGASELQAEIVLKLGVTAVVSSTAFFITLIERLEATGHQLPQAWKLRHAFLGGELGDWAGKRRRLEQRYGIETWSCYGTADFGLIGFERRGEAGYRIHGDRYVQICDPDTGNPLPLGQPGEIVVTTLARGWPMIRFGTGDVSTALEFSDDGGVSRLAPLQGRVGAAVKVREIFIYPAHAERLAREIDGIARAALTVSRNANRDEITGLIALAPGIDAAQVEEKLRLAFTSITRLKLDHIKYVGADEIGEKLIVDQRD